MFLNEFYASREGKTYISAEQASRFAKEIAGDFNPIHDPDSKRFCVPGDLLFALSLHKYGLSQKMEIGFSGMVGRDKPLVFPDSDSAELDIIGDDDKVYTRLERLGETTFDRGVIDSLIRQYVAFSGQNFPFILVPLMEKHGVMFNPKRPLVIYESMSFSLDRLDVQSLTLELVKTTLDVNGKRGDAHFHFSFSDGGQVVGQGEKKLIVSGLRPFDGELMGELVEDFTALKNNYLMNVKSLAG